jgi:hypothetical protein
VKELALALLRSWFGMTSREQKAILLVAAIFLLGLVFRCWHGGVPPVSARPAAAATVRDGSARRNVNAAVAPATGAVTRAAKPNPKGSAP